MAGPGASAAMSRLITAADVNLVMATSPRILAAGMAKAQRAQGIWRGLAPVGPREHVLKSGYVDRPGAYRDSIRITVHRTRTGRPFWRVGSDDYKARWIEFGTRHMPKFACREKTLAQMRGG